MNKSYQELRSLLTFEDRFKYLKIGGAVGRETFGFDRYFNQQFYHSAEWKQRRDKIIVRDYGCDLGIVGREIFDRPIVHHINPITLEDIENGSSWIFDLDNLVLTTHETHNAIHYGDMSLLSVLPKERKKGDTKLW